MSQSLSHSQAVGASDEKEGSETWRWTMEYLRILLASVFAGHVRQSAAIWRMSMIVCGNMPPSSASLHKTLP